MSIVLKIVQLSILVVLVYLVCLLSTTSTRKEAYPYMVVTDMVQCHERTCNAVLAADDVSVLISFDTSEISVGDTIFLRK